MVQDPREAKVSELHILFDVEEDVGWFQVSMKDCSPAVTASVALLQGQHELCHDSQDKLLLQITTGMVKKHTLLTLHTVRKRMYSGGKEN